MLQGSVSPALALATPRQCERFTPLRKVHGRTSRIVSRPSRCTRPWRAEGLLCHAEGGSHASDTSAARYEAVQRQLAKSQRAQARALKRRLLNQLLKEIEVMEQYLAPELLQCQVLAIQCIPQWGFHNFPPFTDSASSSKRYYHHTFTQ